MDVWGPRRAHPDRGPRPRCLEQGDRGLRLRERRRQRHHHRQQRLCLHRHHLGHGGEVSSSEAPAGHPPCGYRQAYARFRRAEARLAEHTAGHGALHPSPSTLRLVEEDLRVGLAAAERLGAAPLGSAVRALAQRSGIRFTRSPRTPGTDVLTPREHAVLSLVARGRTNRQTGAELFISEKTVSVHLSRVMAKLGASSRTEAVSIAHTRGLLNPADRSAASGAQATTNG